MLYLNVCNGENSRPAVPGRLWDVEILLADVRCAIPVVQFGLCEVPLDQTQPQITDTLF
jgi:hypothetical protein